MRLLLHLIGLFTFCSCCVLEGCTAFAVTNKAITIVSSHLSPPPRCYSSWYRSTRSTTQLRLVDAASESINDDADDQPVEPGKMRVSEIKAELDLRSVSYADCFDKEALQQRLVNARATGKADPGLLDKFNKQRLEETFQENKPVEEALSDEALFNRAVGNDGNLPGGLSPQQFQKLVENPDIMALLQSSKMQQATKLMMTGGPEDLQKAMAEDAELLEIVKKLNDVMQPTSSGGTE